MRRRLASLIAAAALLLAGCSPAPRTVPPAPAPVQAAPPQPAPVPTPPPAPTPAPAAPTVTETVRQMLAEAETYWQQGEGGTGQDRLDAARARAAGNAELLTAVARSVLDRNYQLAETIAREAVDADGEYLPAHLALGAAQYRSGKFADALPHLQRAYEGDGHSLEAGYQLALTLEALQETDRAKALLAGLSDLFPNSLQLHQSLDRLNSLAAKWPVPGTPGTAAANWLPDRWWASADILLGLRADKQTLEALDRSGKPGWSLKCSGEVNDVAWEPGGSRAAVFTHDQGCLFDPATGALLGRLPGTVFRAALGGFAWRGDFMAFAEDVVPKSDLPGATAAYFGTNWKVYRLESGADGTLSPRLLYEALDGSRMATLSKDGRTLFSWFGNHGAGRPRLFRDGRLVTDYPDVAPGAEMALGPGDDQFYMVSYQGFLEARTLEGRLLWNRPGADRNAVPILWFGQDGLTRIAVRDKDGFSVYSGEGELLWSAPGWPTIPPAAHGLIIRQNAEMWLYDQNGKVAGRYPGDAFPTADGRAMIRKAGTWIDLYGLP